MCPSRPRPVPQSGRRAARDSRVYPVSWLGWGAQGREQRERPGVQTSALENGTRRPSTAMCFHILWLKNVREEDHKVLLGKQSALMLIVKMSHIVTPSALVCKDDYRWNVYLWVL